MDEPSIYKRISARMHLDLSRTLADNGVPKTSSAVSDFRAELKQLLDNAPEDSAPMPFFHLAGLYHWNDFELYVLCLLVALETDASFLFDCAKFHGDNHSACITPLLAAAVYPYAIDGDELYRNLSPESMLGRLVLEKPDLSLPPFIRPLALRERMRSFLFEGTVSYPPYDSFLAVCLPGAKLPSLYDTRLFEKIIHILNEYRAEKCLMLCIQEEKGGGAELVFHHTANHLGQPLTLFYTDQLAEDTAQALEQVELLFLECTLWNAIPVLCGLQKNQELSLFRKLFRHFPCLFCTSQERIDCRGMEDIVLFSFPLSSPSLVLCQSIWESEAAQYTLSPEVVPGRMSGKFVLPESGIRKSLEMADLFRMQSGRSAISQEDLDQGCYRLLEDMMEQKAVRIPPAFTLEQLILPERQKKQLQEVCNQKRYQQKVYEEWGFGSLNSYGRGLSVVFYGPPGTGKTMAAQVIARELGLELYKIELTSVYSKYIGETEKNLDIIFEQAKKSQIVLFFDEADILFSKRTEVRDSNDKYSNMEAAYLLQKMEAYPGITILATNYIDNFDPAFHRRIKFMIPFPLPDQALRREMWERAFTKKVPHNAIDFDFLSSFSLTGAQIKNIVLSAAFTAAAEDTLLDMAHLAKTLQEEYKKSGRTLQPEEMMEYRIYLK